jgi:hypothetical protein
MDAGIRQRVKKTATGKSAGTLGIFPFETAWLRARAGHLQPGDPAPDFSLIRQNKSGTVQLAALTSQGPVVLVFGSYT